MLFCLKGPYTGPIHNSRQEMNTSNSIQQTMSIFSIQGSRLEFVGETKMDKYWLLLSGN
jgi:hypothetical protein